MWATTDNGAHMPLGAVPTDDGNIAVHRDEGGDLRARVLGTGDQAAPWEKRGTSHFATCPNADQHRKKKPRDRP